MSKNKNLHKANKEKNDEFYTQYSDIEKELKYYKDHFKGKVVFCNCDDPKMSNFYKFFTLKFKEYGLKKLITTHFDKSKPTYKLVIDEDNYWDTVNDDKKPDPIPLEQNGDFRSQESIELLKEADIVVTNPPFSLFREYIAQLEAYDKHFLVVGNQNSITYKDIFKLIKENKIWLGVSPRTMTFELPDKTFSTVNATWFSNLSHKKRNEDLILFKTYKNNENNYPKYDNYDAIEVSKTNEIPIDYDGYMGVPITFLDKYNPNQFEIIGLFADKRENSDALVQGTPTYLDEQHKKYVGAIVRGKATYARIIIKNKNPKIGE